MHSFLHQVLVERLDQLDLGELTEQPAPSAPARQSHPDNAVLSVRSEPARGISRDDLPELFQIGVVYRYALSAHRRFCCAFPQAGSSGLGEIAE